MTKSSVKELLFFRISPDQFGKYPAWLPIYISQIILPMMGIFTVALKIILRRGKDMRRKFFGVSATHPHETIN